MHLEKLIGSSTYKGIFRSYADEPSAEASDWTDEEALDCVNMEHRHLFSVIRGLWEDWFGGTHIFSLTAGTYEYWLPMNCVNIRLVELIKTASISGSSPNYSVNEELAEPIKIEEVLITNRTSEKFYSTQNGFIYKNGYWLYDDKLHFEPNDIVGSNYYCRLFFTPQAPDLHKALATGGAASTITLGTNGLTTTWGDVKIIDNYYKNMRIEIISGTGAGQLRRITQYAGDTKIATVDTAWTTTPDATSVYSIVSPIQEDYQEMLALGAVIRAKGIKVEDDVSGAGAVYEALRADLVNSLDTRNLQRTRTVNQRRN